MADGTIKTYYYHRDTGAPLPGKPGDAAFMAAFTEADTMQPKDVGNVNALIRHYLLSLTFESKRASTQREYKRMLMPMGQRFGTLAINALESPRFRGVFLDYQEDIGRDRPREAVNRLSVLSAVFTYAARKGRIKDNPLQSFERIYSAGRSEMIWTAGDIATFMASAPLELQHAMILSLHKGQRYGDLVPLRWSDYPSDTVRLKQSKTKARVTIFAWHALRRMLDRMERVGPFILARPDGRPWFTEVNDKEMGKQWSAHILACGLRPMPNYPKPKSPSTCDSMICAVAGHTLQSATRILEEYLATTPALSRAAIQAFESSPAMQFANRMKTGPQGADQLNLKMEG